MIVLNISQLLTAETSPTKCTWLLVIIAAKGEAIENLIQFFEL